MNLAARTRVKLGLTPDELALLLNVPLAVVEDLEVRGVEPEGIVHSLLVILITLPQCAKTLVEHRLNELSSQSPDRPMLAALARKINGCHLA